MLGGHVARVDWRHFVDLGSRCTRSGKTKWCPVSFRMDSQGRESVLIAVEGKFSSKAIVVDAVVVAVIAERCSSVGEIVGGVEGWWRLWCIWA